MQPVVIKVGGTIATDAKCMQALFKVIAKHASHVPCVLVHGGGNYVTQLMQQLNLPQRKHNGLRITPAEHIGYVVGALAGTVNRQLCAWATGQGQNNVGLFLSDGNMLKLTPAEPELGQVGYVEPGDKQLLNGMLQAGLLPIISSIGASNAGQILNVNADHAAIAISKLLDAKLCFLTDVKGVLSESGELISTLSPAIASQLIEQEIISGGMVVKVEAAQKAANALGQAVAISHWQNAAALLCSNHTPLSNASADMPTATWVQPESLEDTSCQSIC